MENQKEEDFISDIHQFFFDIHLDFNKVEDQGISDQKFLNKLNDKLYDLTQKIRHDAIFSSNEDLSDILPENIKFFLMPYIQANIVGRMMQHRDEKVKASKKLYLQFLSLMRHYDILSKQQKTHLKAYQNGEGSQFESKMDPMSKRNLLIERAKQTKQIKLTIEKMKKQVEGYEKKKQFYMELAKEGIYTAFKELSMIDQEIEFLKIKESQKGKSQAQIEEEKKAVALPPLQVIRIPEGSLDTPYFTKQQNNQGSVVNQYPTKLSQMDIVSAKMKLQEDLTKPFNPPTMSLDEFAEIQMEKVKVQQIQAEEAKKEKEGSDSEDEEVHDRKTLKARNWDDWKDEHPKGVGNTKRM